LTDADRVGAADGGHVSISNSQSRLEDPHKCEITINRK
jgi:hypothetical protein